MCSQVTAVHRMYYLGQVGTYLPTTMEWQIHTLDTLDVHVGQVRCMIKLIVIIIVHNTCTGAIETGRCRVARDACICCYQVMYCRAGRYQPERALHRLLSPLSSTTSPFSFPLAHARK